MANLNQRVDPVRKGNIPDLRRGVNQAIDKVNWLMGLRVNGGQISEGGRGPIIDIPTAAGAGPTPWATDPDGNAAAWELATFIDTKTGNYFDAWIWAGGTKNVRPVPWLTDPSGIIANWVVCADNTFWGTGNCPAGVGNFQQVHFTFNGPANANPGIYTGNVLSPPITPPTSPPAFYLTSNAPPSSTGLANQPTLAVGIAMLSTDTSPITASFTWSITYDGTQVFSVSGSVTAPDFNHSLQYFILDPTGWLYDPGGLPGYAHGNKQWTWQYGGVISTNTNPTIVQTFSYSCPRPVSANSWNTTLITA